MIYDSIARYFMFRSIFLDILPNVTGLLRKQNEMEARLYEIKIK